jgi:PPM family protein phosphatase
MHRASHARTDIGRKRKQNEDAFLVDDEVGLYVVADGMGGHAAGEVASAEAVDTIHGMIRRGKPIIDRYAEEPAEESAARLRRLVESAVQAATYLVYGLSELDPNTAGMGTTISLLLLVGDHAWIAQVGDSRIYVVRGGTAKQITEDHTLIAWQVRQGLITAEQARTSPHRNVITRAVGNRDYVEVDTIVMPVEARDRFLLCSDGLHTYIESPELPPLVAKELPDATRALVDLANQRGGRDNITVILVATE